MSVEHAERWKRLSPLLDDLLDLDPAGRIEQIASLRARDPGLADELAACLADAQRADAAGFLAGSAEPPVFGGDGAAGGLAGMRIGAYVLEAPLGAGGMGAVWRGRRADGRFAGKAAVKLLHLSLVGPDGSRRFEREGAILAKLSHPHIARLLDAGVTPHGQPYLILELVDGNRIDRHCDAERLRIDERIDLFLDVLAAVAHAHRHLVVHRDIKPANILVTAEDGVKLLDFGIAKLLRLEGDEAPADLTAAGRGALTPGYAAPEQLLGQEVTTATDVYSLGVLLFQLLAGMHPTAPSNATAGEVVKATLTDDPQRLSNAMTASRGVGADEADRIAAGRDTSPARLRRELGGDLDNIVAKALRKAPAERYATVDAFAADLRRWRRGEPVSARGDSLAYRTSRFVTRHRGAVAAGMLTIAAIVAGLVGTISQARRAELAAERANLERDAALRDLMFAGASRDLLGFVFSQNTGVPLKASELLERAEKLVDRQYADDPMSRGRLQVALATQYGNVMEYEKSKQVLLKAQASAASASSPALSSNIDCLLAATLGDQNQPERAMALFDQTIGRLRTDIRDENSILANCLHMRADLHAHLGQPRAMLADAQAALAALATPRPDERALVNSLRVVAAEALGRLGQTAQALAGYEKSLAEMESLGRQQSSQAVVRYANFSRMLYVAGQSLRAAEVAARGLEVSRGAEGVNELDAILKGNRARALVELGRFDEAKALTEQALASALERNDVRWSGTFALYGGPAWCATVDAARCARMLAIARDKLTAVLPKGHPTLGAVEVFAARLSLARQQTGAAREQLQRALALFDAAKEKPPQRIEALALLARLELQAGDAAAASRDATQAVSWGRDAATGLPASEWLGQALVAQALVQSAAGDRASARAGLEEGVVQLDAALGGDAPATREARALLAAA